MNGIDTSAASLLASRIGALGPTGAQGSAGTAQTGVSALAGGAVTLPDAQSADSPQASAQTVLSTVALALDAIIRSGGEATPAVVGRAPVWADPDADATDSADAQSLPLPGLSTPGSPANAADTANAASAAVQALEAALLAEVEAQAGLAAGADGTDGSDGTNAANGATAPATPASQAAQGTQTTQGAALATQAGPVAALAASLAQTVASSGLFYESHLAQWLRGQRTPGELADEAQNRLTGGAQLQLDWSASADDIDDVFWTDLPNAAQQGARNAANASNAAPGAQMPFTSRGAEANAAAFAQEAVRGNAASAFGDTLLPAVHTPPGGAGAAAGVHEALLPLVRQQLDLLATGEFRWTGEAWPGVRLDWTIQPDEYDPGEPRGGRSADEDATPWHTRLTLALPSLGTVDAELTLTGSTLAVRVQASPGGAQRLTDNSEALRGRLEALGLAVAGLSIREIGGGAAQASPADAARAADAYARTAAAQAHDAHAAEAAAATAAAASAAADSTDWERG
ncbi:flagellar hook-length control protein FliK [Paraburkholderia sp. J67]|uniref:flagellar hook-length control protein FliK n=1 Tax=Paraburkholderia sp. J67 TaxID=2805435 RepID=UPI002ABD7BE3|nr:flagellar hook-length control protein FliK [Paraburkholderia sp. J67]